MMPRIKHIEPKPEDKLFVTFDNGDKVIYDVLEDIDVLPDFNVLLTETGLFNNFQIDESRTCVFWNDRVDLPSDTLLEYGTPV